MRGSSAAGLALGIVLLAPPAAATSESIRAGAASVALRVPAGTPLAGYGGLSRRLLFPDVLGRYPHAFWFKPHEGVLDPLAARALVVEGPRARIIWVAVDLIAVDETFRMRVAGRLREVGVPEGTLILSASHTHAGPGAFLDSTLMALVSVDRQDDTVQEALVADIVDAVRRAEAGKAPARVGVGAAAVPGLTFGRLGHPVDSELVVVKIVGESGRPIGALWNYAIHGTSLGRRNLHLSGDVMGIAARRLEATLGAPALFVNGAVGDVSPRRRGRVGAEESGQDLASVAAAVWARASPIPVTPLVLASRRVELPAPRLSVRNCLAGWIPSWLTVPLDSVFPRHADLTAGLLGEAAWVTIPGELQSRLGEELKRSVAGPWRQVFVAGLSNAYAGYLLTSADYDRVNYVTCASLYGPDTGERLIRAARELLATLAAQARERGRR